MAAKPKLRVTTPVGTFTRSTDRTYSHIVVSRGYSPSYVRDRLARELAYNRKLEREYAAVVAGGPLSAIYESQRDRFPAYLDEVRGEIAGHEAKLAQWLADSAAATYSIVGWCGRLDLARKLAAKQAGMDQDVRIFQLDGQEVK
jgi:hypothetical protein